MADSNRLPMILVGGLVLAGMAGLFLLGGGQDRRIDGSVIGIDGLTPWLQAEGFAVNRSNPRFRPTLASLSLRILPLYDVDLQREAEAAKTPREAFYATTMRDTDAWDLNGRLYELPGLVILPKWVAGTVGSATAHDSTLIPVAEIERLPAQIGDWPLQVIRPEAGFLTGTVDGQQMALFHGQLFDADRMPTNCSDLISLPQGVLIASCYIDGENSYPVYLLSDPDLMNNHGLTLGDNAQIASDLIRALAPQSLGTSEDTPAVYIDTAGENLVEYYDYGEERQDYDRSTEDFARFFAPPLAGLWAVLAIVLGLALWRGTRRFGPARGDEEATPEQSKLAAIATNARLLRIAGHDARMAADLVQANLSDLAQTTFGRAIGAGPQGIARLMTHLGRRNPTAANELQAVVKRLTDSTHTLPQAELQRQLDAFRRLLETLTHAK